VIVRYFRGKKVAVQSQKLQVAPTGSPSADARLAAQSASAAHDTEGGWRASTATSAA
jgi:hypothetical protein